VFNYFIIANILVSGLLVLFIFKRLLGKNIFSFCLAIILPWTNIQVQRIWDGDFNLSCSVLPLSALALFIIWYDNRAYSRKKIAVAACMIVLLVFSFIVHGYYIAIISSFLVAMLFFAGIILFREKFGKQNLLAAVIVPLVALAAVMSQLYATDKYLNIRKDGAMCYDLAALKTNFMLLFTHYDFHTLGFPIASTKPQNMEIAVYLGNVGLFAFGAIWVCAVFSTNFRHRVFTIQKSFFTDPLKKSIFWGGMLGLIISLGEHYNTNRDIFKIYTPLPWLNGLSTNQQLTIIGLCVLVIYGVILMVSPKARQQLIAAKNGFARHPYKRIGVLLCAALMIYLFIGRYSAPVLNILNPFFYLHFFTNRVEQFRSLSRFCWPFFWTFYIWIMFTVIQLYNQSGKRTRGVIFILFILIGGIEVSDYVRKMRHDVNNPNIFADQELAKFHALKFDPKQYQAILPIPYYVVGSEDYPHTIDDNDNWSKYTMQLSLYSSLPLMACKMSRTPPEFSIALLDLVSNDSLQPLLKSRLNNKPVLISFNRTLVNDPNQINACASDRPLTRIYYAKANEFVTRHHLRAIDSMGDVIFYSWTPPQ